MYLVVGAEVYTSVLDYLQCFIAVKHFEDSETKMRYIPVFRIAKDCEHPASLGLYLQ